MSKLDAPTWQTELGKQIKKVRKERKVSVNEMAEILGVGREMVRLYEAGVTPPPLPALRMIVQKLEATFVLDGIVISVSSFPPLLPKEVTEQTAFDFQGSYQYVGATVRMSVSKEGFEVIGRMPPKAV